MFILAVRPAAFRASLPMSRGGRPGPSVPSNLNLLGVALPSVDPGLKKELEGYLANGGNAELFFWGKAHPMGSGGSFAPGIPYSRDIMNGNRTFSPFQYGMPVAFSPFFGGFAPYGVYGNQFGRGSFTPGGFPGGGLPFNPNFLAALSGNSGGANLFGNQGAGLLGMA